MGSEWKQLTLGDVVTLKRGYDLPSQHRLPGQFPIVSSSGISGSHNEAKADGPGVVTGRYGTIGQVHFVDGPYWPLNTTLYVQDFKGNHRRYVKYLLETIDYRQYSDKAAVPGINRNHLHEAVVTIPDLVEQERIAGTLASLDRRIDLLRQTNTTLEAIAQALFKSWFVDFDPVHAKAEDREPEAMDAATAALFPSEFEASELGLIPKGWRKATSGEIYEVGIGKTPPRKEPQWFTNNSSDVAWASIRDMGAAGVFLASTAEFLTREAVGKFNVRMVPEGSVLMSFKLTVGRLAIADFDMTTNEAIANFKPKQGSLPQSFLYCFLKSFDMHSLSSTSSIANATNSKAIRDISILSPGLELAQKFDALAGPLLQRIRMQQRQMATLASLRDTLLPRLISGKLRLPEAEAAIESALDA
jgi:type I restriction enzyme S subunit